MTANYPMIVRNGQVLVALDVLLNTGFEIYDFNGGAALDLYIDVELTIQDPTFSLTNSNDPSYISREIYIQEETMDENTLAYETIVETVVGGGLTFKNYESAISRYESEDSSQLKGLELFQIYDIYGSNNEQTILNAVGTQEVGKWSLQLEGTELYDLNTSACRIKKTHYFEN